MGYVTIPKLVEFVVHPFAKGNLNTGGVQWTPVVTNTFTGNQYYTVAMAVINAYGQNATIAESWRGAPGGMGTIEEVEFGLTGACMTTTAANAAVINYQWECRTLGQPSWVPLFAAQSQAAPLNIAYHEMTWSGQFNTAVNANFGKFPFEIRYQIQCNLQNVNAANWIGIGRVKNSSYARVLYRID